MYYSVPGSYNRFSGSPSSIGSRGSTYVNDLSPTCSRTYQAIPSDRTNDVLMRRESGETQVATPPKDRCRLGFLDLSSASSSPTMDVFYDAASTVSASSIDCVPDRFSFADQILLKQNRSVGYDLKSKKQSEAGQIQLNNEVVEQDTIQSLADSKSDLKRFRPTVQREPKLSSITSSSVLPITPAKARRHRSHDTHSIIPSPDSQPHFILSSTSSTPDIYVSTATPLLTTSLSFDLGLYEPIAGYLSYAPCIHPPLPCVSKQSPSSDSSDKAFSSGTAIRAALTENQAGSGICPSQLSVSSSASSSVRRVTHHRLKGRSRRTPDRKDCPSCSASAVNPSDDHANHHFANLSLGLLSDSSASMTRKASFSESCSSSPKKLYATKRGEKKRSVKRHRSGISKTLRDRLKKRARRMKSSKAQIR